MPPVPLTVRIAKHTGIINGTTIPKGTMFHIPVTIATHNPKPNSQKNTDPGGKHMESALGRRCRSIPPRTVAQSPKDIQLDVLPLVVHRWAPCLYWQDYGYQRNESRFSVRLLI
jgi:hypothetical protein